MPKHVLIERTDGRRKGYVPHTRFIGDLIPVAVRNALENIKQEVSDEK